MGGSGMSFVGMTPPSYTDEERRNMQTALRILGLPLESPVADYLKSNAIGPKIRKLKKWSKQTEYGGEV
jgi:hypothetical protein